jgi:glutathione S-transferase
MAASVVFYTNPMSRGRIVRWMLEEVGQPYETHVLDYATTMKAPEYLAINPMGKVPAIVHDGTVVTECAAICAYLADAFPDAGLAPELSDRLRGAYYRWLFFAAGPLEAAASNKALGVSVPAERKAMVGYGSMDDVLATLEGAIGERRYLVGDRFTAADVYVGSHLTWGMMFGTIEKRQTFERYVAGLQQRPAARRAAELDDALIPPKG